MEKKEEKYSVIIPINPIVINCLYHDDRIKWIQLAIRQGNIYDQLMDGKTKQQQEEIWATEIAELMCSAISLYEKQATEPEQVLNDIKLTIKDFDFEQLKSFGGDEEFKSYDDKYGYEAIFEILKDINNVLISHYKHLTNDHSDIPEVIKSLLDEKAALLNTELKKFNAENSPILNPPEKAKPKPIKTDYFLIATDRGLNAAFRLDTSKRNAGIIILDENDLIYQSNHDLVTIIISDFFKRDPKHFSTAAKMVLAKVTNLYLVQHDKVLTLTYPDYMDTRGLTDRKSAREQLQAELDLLWHTTLIYKDYDYIAKRRKDGRKYTAKTQVTRKIRLIQELEFGRGYVNIMLGDTFFTRLQQIEDLNFIAPYPKNLLKLSPIEDFPFSLGDAFARLEREQAGQSNYHKHAVSTLLEELEFPTIEKLKENGERHFSREITKKFDNALKRLIEIGYLTEYTYKEKDGSTADYSRLLIDYDYFITLNVCIETTTPDNTTFIKNRKKHALTDQAD